MSRDYPINKLSVTAERFFKANKRKRFNLHMNRIYDAKEMVLEQKSDTFDAIIIEGIETNAINSPDPASTMPNITTPDIIIDAATDIEYVKLRFMSKNDSSPTQCLVDPLSNILSNPQKAIDFARMHPVALIPVSAFYSKPIMFRTHVSIRETNGIFYIIDVYPSIEEISPLAPFNTRNYSFANPDFLLGNPGGFSEQGGIIIPSTPLNQKKVPGTVFPCKPERSVTSLLGIRGRPATQKDIKNGTTGKRSWHSGIDLGTPLNDPLYAVADGKVSFASPPGKPSGGAGYMIKIKHTGLKRVDGSDFSFMTKYMHNTRNLVKSGQDVKKGQLIALAGTTGASTGPHLHFEARSGTGGKSDLYYEPLWLFDWYANGIKPRSHHEKNFLERTKIVAMNDGHLPRPKDV